LRFSSLLNLAKYLYLSFALFLVLSDKEKIVFTISALTRSVFCIAVDLILWYGYFSIQQSYYPTNFQPFTRNCAAIG